MLDTGFATQPTTNELDQECSAMHEREQRLQDAYRFCEKVTAYHSKSFHLATRFLPAPKRQAIRAFYAFCRTTDDIVDEPLRARYTLSEWRRMAHRPATAQQDPILVAWCDARQRYNVPHHFGEELIDGCEMDLQTQRYQTFEELQRYCYHVASTVGLISMHIIGSEDGLPFDEETTQHAIALGVALQLTNILRDVGEDLRRGRIYLPQEDLDRFGYREADLLAHKINQNFCSLMQFEIERADQLYANHLHGLAKLKQDGRMAVGSAILLYRAILQRIIDNRYDVFTQRARLSASEKIFLLPKIYRQVRRLGDKTHL
ncbi:MAG: phytoene/squalene synthase family protein [Caldilineaceae bacterium]